MRCGNAQSGLGDKRLGCVSQRVFTSKANQGAENAVSATSPHKVLEA